MYRVFLPLGLALGGLYVLYHVLSGSASSQIYLVVGGFIGLEILVMALWNYRQRFLPVLMLVFLLASLKVPFHTAWLAARWGVLAAGAIAGFVLFMKRSSQMERSSQDFGTFHLVAFFAVIAAVVSALVSALPSVALLKTTSLLLVFLYGATGARLAIIGREAEFFAGVLRACEILVYVSAVSYFVFRYPLCGNPNSLGVLMGVVAAPVLVWGVIVSEGTKAYKRATFALVLCLLLLLGSYARAAIGGACLSSVLLCGALRRYRLLLKGIAVALVAAFLMVAISPTREPSSSGGLIDKLTDTFLYKGTRARGLFGSRESPWARTSAAIRDHRWFGTGFGTSVTTVEQRPTDLDIESNHRSTRETANSYLEIVEWTGLLGVTPFFFLILLTGINIGRATLSIRRTCNAFSPAVPIAAVLAAGLFHALFEDWLFAVGYYMCVFFWVFAFALVDVLPASESASRAQVVSAPQIASHIWDGADPAIAPSR